MVELDGGGILLTLADTVRVLIANGKLQNALNTVATRRRARHIDDEVRHFNQLRENLEHVVDERNDLALRQNARIHTHRTRVNQHRKRCIQKKIGQRVHQNRHAPDEKLQLRQFIVFTVEALDFVLLLREGADDAHTRQILPCGGKHTVELVLHTAVTRNAPQHDAENNHAQNGNQHREHKRRRYVNRKRHNHRAEDDEGRAQEQSKCQIDAVLHLIDVAGKARDERGVALFIQLRIGKPSDAGKYLMAQFSGESDRRARGEPLRRNRTYKPDECQRNQKTAHAQNIGRVGIGDAAVDNRGHDKRHAKFKRCLKQLEKRPQNRFFDILLHVDKQFSHETPLFL